LIRLRPDAVHFIGVKIDVERLVETILNLAGAVRGGVGKRGRR
jgi:hypothetical protein